MAVGWQRVFLGWDPQPEGSLLELAAGWLMEHHGPDLGGVVVAVPGGRARRALEQALLAAAARAGRAGLEPPEIVTAGHLPDRLVRLLSPTAGGTVRSFAWWRSLADLGAADLRTLTGVVPEVDDGAGWLALVHEVRRWHGDLAAEGFDFADVAEASEEGEAGRWRALARAQAAYRGQLAAAGLEDPHDARRAALDAGRLADGVAAVVLVGVVDASALVRRTLEAVADRGACLVFAPEDQAAGFDALGQLDTEYWAEATVPLETDHWSVVDHPRDQAELAARLVASWTSDSGVPARVAGAVVVGVPDEQVVPYLERRLREQGLVGRNAQGVPLGRSGPVALLAALCAWLEDRRADDLALLVRHPDLEDVLAKALAEVETEAADLRGPEASGEAEDGSAPEAGEPSSARDRWRGRRAAMTPVERLDRYRAEHLPDRLEGSWPTRGHEVDGARHVLEQLDALLGELALDESRPPSVWAAAAGNVLLAVYGERDLVTLAPAGAEAAARAEAEAHRRLAASLSHCRDALGELSSLPADLDRAFALPAAAALAPVLEQLEARRVPLPLEETSVELLGWLELPLETAPRLVVTGFNDGIVPAAGGPEWPASIREALALPDDRRRLARDAWATTLLSRSRQGPGRALHLISGRRNAAGDPLFPSRLLFHADDEEVVTRLRQTVHRGDEQRPVPTAFEDPVPRCLPRRREDPPVERMSVTSFAVYLRSPYEFYLSRVVGAESVDDGQAEMDGRVYGTLVHSVLEAFGRGPARHSEDPTKVAASLLGILDRHVAARFPGDTLPAVRVQLQQLRRRLGLFARAQARWAAEGWRIRHVEWRPEGGAVPFGPEGETLQLAGQIDRIDFNVKTKAWAVLDYKTGDSVPDPGRSHRRKDAWIDLQLPLYTVLAEPLELPEVPVMGYVLLPRTGSQATVSGVFRLADWSRDELAEALDTGRGVVRDVLAGRFDVLGDMQTYDPTLAAVAGLGLLGGGAANAVEEDGA